MMMLLARFNIVAFVAALGTSTSGFAQAKTLPIPDLV